MESAITGAGFYVKRGGLGMIAENIAPTRAEQLRELRRFGYSEKAIATWSEARIITTLASRRAEE